MKSSIETFLNTTKLNDDNIRDGGITASTKILDGSINTAKLGAECIETVKINDLAITTAKFADLAVGTDALAAASVTLGKLESINSTLSTDKSTTVNNQTSSIATINVTTTGRPVIIMWTADSAGVCEISGAATNATFIGITVQFKRDSTAIATYPTLIWHDTSASMNNFDFPASAYWTVDLPSAGTYAYSMEVTTGSATTATVKGRLLAYEVM
jgi:hypothetical protein